MQVILFGMSKKSNSTKRPVNTDGVTFDMQLKQETSVTNPALIVNHVTSQGQQQPTVFNYAYIPSLQRYYYINDWQYINGAWVCYCSVDVLATYKYNIASLNAYVLRSASAYDGTIADMVYPCRSGQQIKKEFFSMSLSQTGVYVIGIINDSSYATDGAITYYMMTAAELGALKSFLLSDAFISLAGLGNFQDIPKDFIKSYFNPLEYIASCRFFPIDYDTATRAAQPVTELRFGWANWKVGLGTKRMPQGFYMDIQTDNVTVGVHPQAAARGDYLNHAPYSERVLIHPMLGTIPLDSNKIDAGDQLTITTRVDFTTGEALSYVGNATKGITLYTQSYMLAINVQLAQISQDMFTMARSIVDTGISIASGGLIPAGDSIVKSPAGMIGGAISGIFNTLQSSQPILSSTGCNGNRAVYHVAIWFQQYFNMLVDEDNADKGRPLCKVRTLGSLSGYILCNEAHADFPAYDGERQLVEGYLNSGFFYE